MKKRKELEPPFVPSFANRKVEDAAYFDREFTKRAPRDSPAVAASANAQSIFRGFSYSKASEIPTTPEDHEKSKF